MKKSAKRLIGGYILINLLSIGLDFDGSTVEITDKQILNQLDGLKKYSNGYTGIKQLKPVLLNVNYGTVEDNDVTGTSIFGSIQNYGDDSTVSVIGSYVDVQDNIYTVVISCTFATDDFEGLHIESATIYSYRNGNIIQNKETNTTEIGNNVEIDGKLTVNTKPVIANGTVSEGVVTLDDISKFKNGEIVSIRYDNADLSVLFIGTVDIDESTITIICTNGKVYDADSGDLVDTSQIEINKTTKVLTFNDLSFTAINVSVEDVNIKHLM